jgi:6-phosphogluconolactonase/glucosamine-6-phosphate isomerase/deaminase
MALEKAILEHLERRETVLWLLSGGSSVEPAVEASRRLKGHDLNGLMISLADERWGQPGHDNSNWQGLLAAGFNPGNANIYPVLTGRSFKETANGYNLFLDKSLNKADYRLALLGIGADGHTAGILPGSPVLDSDKYGDSYITPEFKRITITPNGMARLNEVIVYCAGPNKAKALADLDNDLPISVQPAQIIKRIPKVSVYNDIRGDQI